jgi:predicted RNA-binding Zn-ribbon protein involved in translation (DUF1610 family)
MESLGGKRQQGGSNNSDSCNECGGRFVVAPPRALGDAREYVCSKCGIVAPFPEDLMPVGSEKYGRSIQSFGVLGNNEGSMMSMRNGNGLSDLYYLRGSGVVHDLMPGHLTGLEEPNKALANFKMKIVQRLTKMQSEHGRAITGDQGTMISSDLRAWVKKIRELTSEYQPLCMRKSRANKQMQVIVIKADFDKEYIKAFRRA